MGSCYICDQHMEREWYIECLDDGEILGFCGDDCHDGYLEEKRINEIIKQIPVEYAPSSFKSLPTIRPGIILSKPANVFISEPVLEIDDVCCTISNDRVIVTLWINCFIMHILVYERGN